MGKEGRSLGFGEDWLSLLMWKQRRSSVFFGGENVKALHETVCTVDTSALDFRSKRIHVHFTF